MNLDNMRTWVDALYNDTDGQCVGELVDMRGCHCVIGVGIKASGRTPSPLVAQYDQINEFYDWLDCNYGHLVVPVGHRRHYVIDLNDKLRMTFREIGELIETEFLTPADT